MKKRIRLKEEKSLKYYLIYHFMVIIVVIAVLEGLISLCLAKFFNPLLTKLLVFTDFSLGRNSSGSIQEISTLVFFLFVTVLVAVLPEIVVKGLEFILQRVNINLSMLQIKTSFPPDLSSIWLENLYLLGLFFLFFVILILILLPYLIGAITFSQMVTKKVEEPILTLTNAMDEVSKRKLETRVDIKTEHEFTRMINAFNTMANQMEENVNEKLEYEKRRNLLLSDIAHDLKTPITTITGYASALAEGVVKTPEDQLKYIEAIRRKSLRLDELINLLFEYVKLDSKGFQLNPKYTDVAELCRENIALLYSDFEEKEMPITLNLPPKKVMANVDVIQFSRVITNICNNAIRYNQRKTSVYFELKEEIKDGVNRIKITIGDGGEPIDQEIASHIFEPFVTGDRSRNTKGGSGLGLSIAKKIMEMHKGTLILTSQKSSQWEKAFVLTLPLEIDTNTE